MRHAIWVVLAMLVHSEAAWAHHVGGPPPRQGGELDGDVAAVGVDTSMGSVQLVESETVQFSTLAVSTVVRLFGVSFGTRVPFHRITGEHAASGLGDMSLRAGYEVQVGAQLRAQGSVDIQLPTGESGKYLGYGSAAVLGTLGGSYRPDEQFSVTARVGMVLDPRSGDSMLSSDPAYNRVGSEFRTAVGGVIHLGEYEFGSECVLAEPLSGPGTLVLAVPSARLPINHHMNLGLYSQIPIYNQRAVDWRLGLRWSYQWSSEHKHKRKSGMTANTLPEQL